MLRARHPALFGLSVLIYISCIRAPFLILILLILLPIFFFFLLVVFYGIFFTLSFFRYSPILESVDVSLVPFNRLKRLTKVSDDFLLALASLPCPNLVAVNVAGHASITDFGVTALAYRLPALRRFDVTCCAAVTRQGQAGVSAICKSKATEADFDCGVSVGSLSSSEDDMSE